MPAPPSFAAHGAEDDQNGSRRHGHTASTSRGAYTPSASGDPPPPPTAAPAATSAPPTPFAHTFDRVLPDAARPSRKVKRESKRSRGEIACAECRRLKVKCDRTVPCSTCVKRGCAALCPNGTIPPGEGSRFVLAATEHLTHKMARVEARMHALEDALAIACAAASPHPLLADLSSLKDEQEEKVLKDVEEDGEEAPEEKARAVAEALGALQIVEDSGAIRVNGPLGGPETAKELFPPLTSPPPSPPNLDPSYLPPPINAFFAAFPLPPPGLPAGPVLHAIASLLPPEDRARQLCCTHLEHMSWITQVVGGREMCGALVPAVYARVAAARAGAEERTMGACPHDLALLLALLAVGALADPALPPYNGEAQHYYRLARAAAGAAGTFEAGSVRGVKVLHLLAMYNGMGGKEEMLETADFFIRMAAQVALRIGLHMDPSLWSMEGLEAYDRRVCFYTIFAGDLWQSLITGQPPVIDARYVTCRIPTYEEEEAYQQGEVPVGFGVWGCHYVQRCVVPVACATVSVTPPTLARVLEVDRAIREFAAGGIGTLPLGADARAASLRTFVRSSYIDLLLIYLHRGFFAEAMTHSPADPLASPFAYSFRAAYKASCALVQTTKRHFARDPFLGRIWRVWSFCFCAAVIVGTVASHCPHLILDPDAYIQFEDACALFDSAAETSTRASRALPIIQRLRQKAQLAQQQQRQQQRPSTSRAGSHEQQSMSDLRTKGRDGAEQDEVVEIFAGKTRLLIPKHLVGARRAQPVPALAGPAASAAGPAFVEASTPYPATHMLPAPPVPRGCPWQLPPHSSPIASAHPAAWEGDGGAYRGMSHPHLHYDLHGNALAQPSTSYGHHEHGGGAVSPQDEMDYGGGAPPSGMGGQGVMLRERWSSFVAQL